MLNVIFHASIISGDLTPGHGGRVDERHDRVEFVSISSLADFDLNPPVSSQIAEALRERSSGRPGYLGNVWRQDAASVAI